MARKSSRGAQGGGTIRKKTVTRLGKEYTYWEARITTGRDPGTGKQIQRSFTGKTQKEVREKMQVAAVEINQGTYTAPSRFTVGQWLDIWQQDYFGGLKPRTVSVYKGAVKNHIKPAMGAIRLVELHPHMVQEFVNSLKLSPSSARLVYNILRLALEKAVQLEYIPRNPAQNCELPRVECKEIQPLNDEQAAALLEAAKNSLMEYMVGIAMFTGMRLSELLGLTWDCVDLNSGLIKVNKQMAHLGERDSGIFISPKNGKSRTIAVAPSVVKLFKAQRRHQLEMQLKAGGLWNNLYNLVFTTSVGGIIGQRWADREFKRIAKRAGLEGVRFHDTRHTYAVNAIRAGDDIKTIQSNLGHATAAFTLDRYGHFTETMQQASATRMEHFIKDVLNL